MINFQETMFFLQFSFLIIKHFRKFIFYYNINAGFQLKMYLGMKYKVLRSDLQGIS